MATLPPRLSLLDRANVPTAYVENDGVCLLSPVQLGGAFGNPGSARERMRAVMAAFSTRIIPYYSAGGRFELTIELMSDIVASLPRLPPKISDTLEQAAIDALMDLGTGPEVKEIDRKFALHGDYGRTIREFDALLLREEAEQAVSRVIDGERIAARAQGKSARESALTILDLVRTSRTEGLVRPADAEIAAASAELLKIKTAMTSEFDSLIVDINESMAAAFSNRFGSARETVEPEHRQAYDKAVSLLKEAGESRRLFIRPRMIADMNGGLRIEIRHSTLATALRIGGFQSRLDVSATDSRMASLLERRGTALWLRLADPEGLSSWHAKDLLRLRAAGLAKIAEARASRSA